MIPKRLPTDLAYWDLVKAFCKKLKCDGCTGALEIYNEACWEHDLSYRTGKWVTGEPITRAEADKVLRMRIQSWSPLGKLSPMSYWRWLAVRIFGWFAWKGGNG